MKTNKRIDKEKGFEILSKHGFVFENANEGYICFHKTLLKASKGNFGTEDASVSILYLHHHKQFTRVIHINPLFKDRRYIETCEKALEKWEELKARIEAEGMIFGDD